MPEENKEIFLDAVAKITDNFEKLWSDIKWEPALS